MPRVLEEYLQGARRNIRSVNGVREYIRGLGELNNYVYGRPIDPSSFRYFDVLFYGSSPLWFSLCVLEPVPEILVRNVYSCVKKLHLKSSSL